MQNMVLGFLGMIVALALLGCMSYCGYVYQTNTTALEMNCQNQGGIYDNRQGCIWSKNSEPTVK